MVISFVVIFIVCFLPYHTYMLWFHFYPFSREVYDEFWHAFRIIGFCLSFINSCINPIALYYVSGAFRRRWVTRASGWIKLGLLFFPHRVKKLWQSFPATIRFNEYLCCCIPSARRHGANGGRFPRTRGDASTLCETSFNSTYRRHTQELNSTALFNLGNDHKPAWGRLRPLRLRPHPKVTFNVLEKEVSLVQSVF